MYKAIILVKKKRGMTTADFMAYYEGTHAPLGASKIPNLRRYLRHYVRPYGNDVYSTDAAPYDVLTELWFDDEAEFKKGMAYLTEPETAAIIGADEERFVERSELRFMIMTEDRETDL